MNLNLLEDLKADFNRHVAFREKRPRRRAGFCSLYHEDGECKRGSCGHCQQTIYVLHNRSIIQMFNFLCKIVADTFNIDLSEPTPEQKELERVRYQRTRALYEQARDRELMDDGTGRKHDYDGYDESPSESTVARFFHSDQ